MHLLLAAASGLVPTSQSIRMDCTAVVRSSRPLLMRTSFRRGSDLLQWGDAVTERDVVNVLGRWQTHEEWDAIGGAARLDDFSNGDFYEDDVPAIATNFDVPDHIARRPQRRDFCRRNGLVQRCWHNENVAMLPFTDDALAASVGATAEQLNTEPINPLAADVVFDGARAHVGVGGSAPSADDASARASRLCASCLPLASVLGPHGDPISRVFALRARPRSSLRLALLLRAERRVRRAACILHCRRRQL